MKCPIFAVTRPTTQSNCVERECALWDDSRGQCSIKTHLLSSGKQADTSSQMLGPFMEILMKGQKRDG